MYDQQFTTSPTPPRTGTSATAWPSAAEMVSEDLVIVVAELLITLQRVADLLDHESAEIEATGRALTRHAATVAAARGLIGDMLPTPAEER